jgi:CRP-like cAMP-binding protein
MKTIHVKKGQILQHRGDTNSKIYKVESGLLRSYSIDEKGKEHIFMFAPEDWVIADASIVINQEAELFIDALEDSTIEILEKEANIERIDASPLLKRIAVLQKRVIMLMSSSAIERYEHFVSTYPNIIQRVPQKMIASYLGITPEALSKVKGDRVRTK